MWHFETFSLSKREIIVSIAILAIMLVFGFMIHGAINESLMLKYQEYNTALQIDNDTEMFKYAMKTNVGKSFVYGEVRCVDTVTYSEIGGEYSYIEKIKEEYTRHTQLVTHTYTDSDGNTYTETVEEEYWTWDEVGRDSKQCEQISFLDVNFKYGQISLPGKSYLDTIKVARDVRYVYYGAPTSSIGTLYSDLRNNTINKSKFYSGQTISETIDFLESGGELILFWIGWLLLIAGLIFVFIYLDNHWLEDSLKKHK
jgi:hypothetical protein